MQVHTLTESKQTEVDGKVEATEGAGGPEVVVGHPGHRILIVIGVVIIIHRMSVMPITNIVEAVVKWDISRSRQDVV